MKKSIFLVLLFLLAQARISFAQTEQLLELVSTKYKIDLQGKEYEISSGMNFRLDPEKGTRLSFDVLTTEDAFFVFLSQVTDTTHFFDNVHDVVMVRREHKASIRFAECDQNLKRRFDLFSVYHEDESNPSQVFRADVKARQIIETSVPVQTCGS